MWAILLVGFYLMGAWCAYIITVYIVRTDKQRIRNPTEDWASITALYLISALSWVAVIVGCYDLRNRVNNGR